ncbi:MAG: hypothetical protein AABX29_04715 [Nanoarchaeota archaeon]|mgnify:CR=1 FL=1
MQTKLRKGVTKCVTRIEPRNRKIRKSIRLPLWLWISLETFGEKNKLNRSQAVQRACIFFISNNKNEVLMDLEEAKLKVAYLEQKLKNIKERKNEANN